MLPTTTMGILILISIIIVFQNPFRKIWAVCVEFYWTFGFYPFSPNHDKRVAVSDQIHKFLREGDRKKPMDPERLRLHLIASSMERVARLSGYDPEYIPYRP